MKKRVAKLIILKEITLNDLENQINSYLEEGWFLHHKMFERINTISNTSLMCQVMIKYEEDKISEV